MTTRPLPLEAPSPQADTGPKPLSEVLAARHLPALDGLRMIAVFTVIAFHYREVGPAYLGVNLFFVLSGFLITWLLLKEQNETGGVSLRSFYARRTLRIFPAYYTFVALCVALGVARGRVQLTKGLLACALTYTMNYYEALLGGPTNSFSHAWSLAQEEQFYLLWPAVFLLLAQRGKRALTLGLGTSILLVVAWRSYLFLVAGVGAPYVYHAFDTRFDNLAVGCLLAALVESPVVVRLAQRAAARPWLPLVTVALILASGLGSREYRYSVGLTVEAALMAILVTQCLQLHRHPLWRWLDHPVVRYLGRISYPLYLYHGLTWSIGQRLQALPDGIPFAITVGATVGVATASYHLVEKPFLALKSCFAT